LGEDLTPTGFALHRIRYAIHRIRYAIHRIRYAMLRDPPKSATIDLAQEKTENAAGAGDGEARDRGNGWAD
jgi:hypothetical protein